MQDAGGDLLLFIGFGERRELYAVLELGVLQKLMNTHEELREEEVANDVCAEFWNRVGSNKMQPNGA